MWAFRLNPAPQELLSSFVSRVAHAHGATAGPFCRLHLRDSWYWTRDVDRGVAVAQHERLAALAGIEVTQIEALTLRRWIEALTPSNYRSNVPAAVTPWVTAVGLNQARRRHGALAFCPPCLDDTGVSVKSWRLAFHTHCEIHRRPLLDACPRCSALFVPHLSRRSARHCHACGHSMPLAELKRGTVPLADQAALRMQHQMNTALQAACEADDDARHRLHGLRVLLSLCWRGRSDCRPADQRIGAPRLEVSSVALRITAMAWLSRVLEGWPESFRRITEDGGLTQQTFSRTGVLANWLAEEIDRLPVGQRRVKSRRMDALQMKTRPPVGAVAVNWRAKRARALMMEALRGR